MPSHTLLRAAALLIATALSLVSCDEGGVTGPEVPPSGPDSTVVDTRDFRALITSVGPPPEVTNERVETPAATSTEERGDELWRCTTTRVDLQQGGGGSEGYSLYSPIASVVYPGNLLQGASLSNATPDVVAVDRAGGAFSIDVIDGNITSSFEVDEVKKSTVSDALNAIVRDATGVVPANFSFSYESIQSREQLAASLRMSYESFRTQLEGRLSFSTDRSYNRYVVKLNQSYYTMSYDLPTSLDDVFAPSVTPDDLARYTAPGNPVTYISDVTYGRTYYMLIESTSTRDEMSAAISGSFNGVAASVDGEANVDAMRQLQNLTIKVFGYGGDAGSTLQTIGVTDLPVLADLLARAGTITTGKPLSYVVRSLFDNRVVSTQLATSYDLTNCVPVAPSTFPYTASWTGEVLDRMGPVGAAYAESGTTFILIAEDGTQFCRTTAAEVSGPFPISDLFFGEELPITGITAAASISGNETDMAFDGRTVMFVDGTGTNYTYYIYRRDGASGRFHDPTPVSTLGRNDSPLIGGGIGAMAAHRIATTSSSTNRYIFNVPGRQWSYFDYDDGNARFGNAVALADWGPRRDSPFDAVGAGLGFSIQGRFFTILFNKAGTQYALYAGLNGEGPRFHGPFDL